MHTIDLAALAVIFGITNIDGFTCLAAAGAVDSSRRWLRSSIEAAAAFAILVLAALLASLVVRALSVSGAAWLGVIPVAIGLGKVISAFGEKRANAQSASIAAIVFATGIDNVAMYVPAFALLDVARATGVALVYLLAFAFAAAMLLYFTPNVIRLQRYRRQVDVALGVFFIFIGVEMTRGLFA